MSLVIQCPTCKTKMTLPAGVTSGDFICPNCKTQLRIGSPSAGGGVPAGASPTQTTWQSLPKPVQPSASSAKQASAFWQEASEVAVEAERRRKEAAPPVPSYRLPTRDAGKTRSKGSSSPVVTCLAVVGGIAVVGALVLGLLFAVFVFAGTRSTTLANAGFQVTANGGRKTEKRNADSFVVGVENFRTKSGFTIVHRDMPGGRGADLKGYLDVLRTRGSVGQVSDIEKHGLKGIHYMFVSSNPQTPTHTGEVFQTAGAVIILMYIPGSSYQQSRGSASRYSGEEERSIDDPESFFASFRPA